MSESVWILQYRSRERSNGKWSEWKSMDNANRPCTAYTEMPQTQIFSHIKYQRRAVEYKRVEPETASEVWNTMD